MKQFLEKKVFVPLSLLFLSTPQIGEARTFRDVAKGFAKTILGPIIQLFLVLALVLFIWGVVEFIRNADNKEARERGKQRILWGIIGLFVMLTFLSIVGILTGSFLGSSPILPQFYE